MARFLSLLAHFRVRRPLDGVILTIPLSEFVGPEKIDVEMLNQRANYISQNLTNIEKYLGMRVPVYVVFTKCDMVSGFKEFSRSLTQEIQKEIFGWAPSSASGTVLQVGWIEQAFDTMRDALREAQIEIFSKEVDEKNRPGVVLFPENFAKLKEKISMYLMGIFQESGYRDAYFFRGMYFTGDISWQPQENENVYATCQPTQPISSYGMDNPRQIIFSSQLVGDKVFPEYVLAMPGRRRIIAASRAINVVRFIIVGWTIAFIFIFAHDYMRIKDEFQFLIPTLERIKKSLENAPKNKLGVADQFDRLFYDSETKAVISSLAILKNRNFSSFAFPPSWTHPIELKLEKALSVTLNSIILTAIRNELIYRFMSVIEDPLPYVESNIKELSLLNPLETTEFLILNGYVIALEELLTFIDKYKNLGQSKSLKDLEEIITFLFQIHFIKDMGDLKGIYERGFDYIEENPIHIEIYSMRAQHRLNDLFMEFLAATTGNTGGYSELVGLSSELTSLGETRKGSLPIRVDVDNLLERINKDVTILSSSGLAWLNNAYFYPGDGYTTLMGNIYSFPLLDL